MLKNLSDVNKAQILALKKKEVTMKNIHQVRREVMVRRVVAEACGFLPNVVPKHKPGYEG